MVQLAATYEPPQPTVWGGHNETPAPVTWNQARGAGRETAWANTYAVCVGDSYPNACWNN